MRFSDAISMPSGSMEQRPMQHLYLDEQDAGRSRVASVRPGHGSAFVVVISDPAGAVTDVEGW